MITTITRLVRRDQVTTEWALWTDLELATHAVQMTRDDGTGDVWVGTDAATASTYARVNGTEYAARIVEPVPDPGTAAWTALDALDMALRSLNEADGEYAIQQEGTVYQVTVDAVIELIYVIVGGHRDLADAVYARALDNGESFESNLRALVQVDRPAR